MQSLQKLVFLFLVGSLTLVSCPNSNPPPATDVTAKAGTVQIANWSGLHPEGGSFQIKPPGAAIATQGTVDINGRMSFLLPDTYPISVAVSSLLGTVCTTTPADSTFTGAYFYVKSDKESSAHFLNIAKVKSSSSPSINDQALENFWIYAPKAFTFTGAKGCFVLRPLYSFDMNVKQGWNYVVGTVVSLSADGKQVTEWKITTENSTLPADFVWNQDLSNTTIASTTGLGSMFLPENARVNASPKP